LISPESGHKKCLPAAYPDALTWFTNVPYLGRILIERRFGLVPHLHALAHPRDRSFEVSAARQSTCGF